MEKEHSYWIIAYFDNYDWEREYLLINQKSENWNFRWYPKWHPEIWENWIQTAKREFFEEVWISDVSIIWNKVFETMYICHRKNGLETEKTVTFWVWKVKNKNIKIQEEELNWYKWANFDTAMKLLSHKNYKDILENVKNYLNLIK